MLRRSSIPTQPLQSTRYGDDKYVEEKFCPYSTTPIYQVWGWQGCWWKVQSLLHHSHIPGMGMTRMWMRRSIPTPPLQSTRLWRWQGCEWEVLSLLHHSSLPGMGMTRMWVRSSIPTPPLQSTRYGDVKDVDETFYPYSTTPIYQVYGDDRNVDETFYPYSTTPIYLVWGCQGCRWDVLSLLHPLKSTRYGDDKDVDEKIYPYSTTTIYQVWGWQGCWWKVQSLLHHSHIPGMGMTGMWIRCSVPTPQLQSTRYGDDKDVSEKFYPYSTIPI